MEADLLASLLRVARVAGEGTNLDAALENALEAARSATGAAGASLLMLDEQGRYARGVYSRGHDALAVSADEARHLLGDGLAGWVVRTRAVARIDDVSQDARWHSFAAQANRIGSALSAPIQSGTALVGVLTLVHPERSWFRDEHGRLLESAAAQIALALRNAQIADARARVTLLNRVLEISIRRAEASDIAREAAEVIAAGTRWPHVYVALPGEDGRFRLHGRTAAGAPERPLMDRGLLGRVFTRRVAESVDEVSGRADDSATSRPGVAVPRPRSRLAIPLRQPSGSLGVIAFESERPGRFDDEEVAFAEALAEAVSLGLGKASHAQARAELTRALVHDLRGPVTSILTSLELLRRDGMSANDLRLLDVAEKNARRQATLIEGILELSRLERGTIPLRRSAVRLGGLVDEVLRLAAPRAEARHVTLSSEVPPDLPAPSVDRELVSRVLENLVDNAIKFSPPSGAIRVAGRVEGPTVEIRVSDEGPGIDESVRPRLFQSFATGNVVGKGSGLGLAFCRLAILAHGGRIWVESPEAAGTTIAFSLPAETFA